MGQQSVDEKSRRDVPSPEREALAGSLLKEAG
jgi:hypothetical protein